MGRYTRTELKDSDDGATLSRGCQPAGAVSAWRRRAVRERAMRTPQDGTAQRAAWAYVYPVGDRDAGRCKLTRSRRTSPSAASRRDSLVDLARWQFRDTLNWGDASSGQRVKAYASARVFPPASFIDEPRRTSESEGRHVAEGANVDTSEGRQCVLGLMWSCPRRGGLEMRSGAHSLH